MRPDNTRYRNYILDFQGIVVMVGALFITSAIIAVLMKFNIVTKEMTNEPWFFILGYLVNFLPSIFAFDYFIMRKNAKKLNFNMQSKNIGTYFLIFPMMFGMMLIVEYLTSLIPIKGFVFGKWFEIFSEAVNSLSIDYITMFFLTSFLAPILEEILFRGIIQKGLINGGLKPITAIVVTSFIFGAIHMNPWQFVGGFFLGLVLGLVYYKTKSLLMPILLHFFNNFISTLLITKYNTESFADAFNIADWQLFLVGIVIFFVFYYLFMFKHKIAHQEI